MKEQRLTALRVARTHSAAGRILLSDGDGLYLRKQSVERSTWTLRYRFADRDRWMLLGHFPAMSLAQARIEARAKRVLLDRQRDPLEERRAIVRAQKIEADRSRYSFAALAEDWYATEIKGRLKHPQVPRRYLDKYLLPEFGARMPTDISPAEASRLLGRVSRTAPTASNDLLRFLKRIFRFGVRRRVLTVSPVADFDLRDAGGQERCRQRALSQDELVTLLQAMRESTAFGGINYLAVKLLLALGVRKGELIRATWSEFDLDAPSPVWCLPASRTKTQMPLKIPLVPAVVEWLKALQAIAGSSQFVLPHRRRDPRQRGQHLGIDTLNAALKELPHGLEHFTLHDLRRTMRTHLAALGVRSEVAERCLGHRLRGVEGIYNSHDYLPERRAALETWTALLLDIETGLRKVTPIRKAAR